MRHGVVSADLKNRRVAHDYQGLTLIFAFNCHTLSLHFDLRFFYSSTVHFLSCVAIAPSGW